jgi:hypothetical protein
MFPFWKPALATAFCVAAGLIALVVVRERDPVVDGKRMSEWAFSVVERSYPRESYFIPRAARQAFGKDRDAAIIWLQAAINYRPSAVRVYWRNFARKLPKKVAERVQFRGRLVANRWAAVLALSHLAREQPDGRIPEIFLEAMTLPNVPLRKVVAYEAGPWLCPDDPGIAAEILRMALADPSFEVRRDACRRIAESATSESPAYRDALQPLLPFLVEMRGESQELANFADAAISRLTSGAGQGGRNQAGQIM